MYVYFIQAPVTQYLFFAPPGNGPQISVDLATSWCGRDESRFGGAPEANPGPCGARVSHIFVEGQRSSTNFLSAIVKVSLLHFIIGRAPRSNVIITT